MAMPAQLLRIAVIGAALALAGCGAGTPPTKGTAAGPSRAHARPSAAPTRQVPALIAPAGAPARSIRVPVLTYHRVAPLKPGASAITTDLTVEPSVFAAELDAIAAAGFHTVTQRQVFDALYRGVPLPPKPVLISVDDGYVDDVRTILPMLRSHGMVATFFVITGRIHAAGFMSAQQFRELDAAGMDVGDHTRTHVDLTQLPAAGLQAEVAGSKAALERILGHPVSFFAYPFGRLDANVVAAVRAAGFALAYTTAYGVTATTARPLEIGRLHVGRSETPTGVVSLLGG
jgi:peptidoglycan/xylan/chitin deacetylase (PgdA/CDA1 family)